MRHGVVFLDVMGMSLLRRTYKADEGGPSHHLAEVRTRWRPVGRFDEHLCTTSEHNWGGPLSASDQGNPFDTPNRGREAVRRIRLLVGVKSTRRVRLLTFKQTNEGSFRLDQAYARCQTKADEPHLTRLFVMLCANAVGLCAG